MKVKGRGQQTEEVVELYKNNKADEIANTFRFRFIQFEYNQGQNRFEPIVFDIVDTQSNILEKHSNGLSQT
jgi:hypothetical protein